MRRREQEGVAHIHLVAVAVAVALLIVHIVLGLRAAGVAGGVRDGVDAVLVVLLTHQTKTAIYGQGRGPFE